MALVQHRSPLIEAEDPTPDHSVETAVSTLDLPVVLGRGLKANMRHVHADCKDCCGRSLCHFCLRPAKKSGPFGGMTWLRWAHNGYEYAACEDHERLLRTLLAGGPAETMPGCVASGFYE